MHWNKITYDKHSCAMHWDCMAYDKHSCAMHFDCIAYDMHSIGIAVRNGDAYVQLKWKGGYEPYF